MDDQFARTKRVGDHHPYTDGERVGREDVQDGRDGQPRELAASVLLRDNQPHEALGLDEVIDFLRNATRLADLVVVEHTAQLHERAGDEGLLFCSQPAVRLLEHRTEVGLASEDIAIKPDISGFKRLALGFGDLREDFHLLHQLEDEAEEKVALTALAGAPTVGTRH